MEKGKEGRVMALDEIKELCLKDLAAIAGANVNVEGWRTETAPATQKQDIPPSTQVRPATFQNVWNAGQAGLHVNDVIKLKDVAYTSGSCFIIEEITADKEVILKNFFPPYHLRYKEVTITLADLLDKWQRADTSSPEKLDAVQTRDGLSIDMLRVQIFEAICAADSMSQAAQSLEFWKHLFKSGLELLQLRLVI